MKKSMNEINDRGYRLGRGDTNPPSSSSGEELDYRDMWKDAEKRGDQLCGQLQAEISKNAELTRLQSQQAEGMRYSADDMRQAFNQGARRQSWLQSEREYDPPKNWTDWIKDYQPSAPTPDKNREI